MTYRRFSLDPTLEVYSACPRRKLLGNATVDRRRGPSQAHKPRLDFSGGLVAQVSIIILHIRSAHGSACVGTTGIVGSDRLRQCQGAAWMASLGGTLALHMGP